MKVKRLEIINFRNYKKQVVELSEGINIFVGENAQGKTNLLEAVYLTSVGKSPRTSKDKELIKWGETRSKITVDCETKAGNERVEIILDKTENKRISINGMPVSRIGELMGVVSTVFFSPGELKIVQAAPGERRSFIDIAVCQISRAYFYLLNRYNKILSQRNRLLKTQKADNDSLAVWDLQICECGAKIVKTRKGFIKNLNDAAKKNHLALTGGKEDLELEYEGIEGDTLEAIKEEYQRRLNATRLQDLKNGYTNVGPHKDDFLIKANGVDLRSFGSQGQQRTAALSLKLAELDLNYIQRNDYPILLLDDVFSELDLNRQEELLYRIQNFQTIITCTHLEERIKSKIKDYVCYKVELGQIVQN